MGIGNFEVMEWRGLEMESMDLFLVPTFCSIEWFLINLPALKNI